MRLQVVADQASSKHTGDSRNRGKTRAAGVADHDAGPSRAWRCAPLANFRCVATCGSSLAYLSGRQVSRAGPGLSRSGGAWACWIWRCARAPGLTSVHDPRVSSGAGDEMFDEVIPLGEALRPLDLSRRSTRVACRQRGFGSRPRRIGVSEGLTRAKGRWKVVVVVGRSGMAGTRCHTAQPKPGSSGQSICPVVGCRRLAAGRAAA